MPWTSESDRISKHLAGLLFLPFDLIRSGIKPRRDEPKAWYDRLIRVAGGILYSVLASALVVKIIRDALKSF